MQSVHHQRQYVRQSEVDGWKKGGDHNDLQAYYGRRFKGMSPMIIAWIILRQKDHIAVCYILGMNKWLLFIDYVLKISLC